MLLQMYLSLALVILSRLALGYQELAVKMIDEFLLNEETPTLIATVTCWDIKYLRLLAQTLSVPILFDINKQSATVVSRAPSELLFLADLDCERTFEFLHQAGKYSLVRHPYRWMFMGTNSSDWNRLSGILPAFTDSNVFLAQFDGVETMKLRQFYKISDKSEIIFEDVGVWSSSNGILDTRSTRILSRRRRDLRQLELRASVVLGDQNSKNHLTDGVDKHIDAAAKINYVLVNQLIDAVNGSRKFSFVGSWGGLNPKTGRWSGMLGDIMEDRADIGGTPLFTIPERVHLIEYLSMTTKTGGGFVFRAPPLSYVANIYSLPFKGLVWLSCGGLLLIGFLIIYMTINAEDSTIKIRITDVILLAVGSICQMGSDLNPKFISSRISVLFLFLAFLFLYTSYTANIVALLQSTTKSINTLADLLSSDMDFGVDDTIYNRVYFPVATEPVRSALYRTKIAPPNEPPKYMNLSYGVSRLREGFFAFHMEMGIGYKLIEETFFEHEKCNLLFIGFLQFTDPWLAIPKNSKFKEMLKVNLLKIREHGLQSRENMRIYTSKPVCDSSGASFGSVRLIDCYAVVIVLLFGMIISLTFFACERLLTKYGKKLCLI